jgi:hypothetical protein
MTPPQKWRRLDAGRTETWAMPAIMPKGVAQAHEA